MVLINNVRRGDVWFCQLDKVRPCVIVSNNKLNISSEYVIAIPLSSHLKRLDLPSHVVLSKNINGVKAMAMSEFFYQVEQIKLHNYVCTLSESDMNNINLSLKKTLQLDEL